MTRTSRGGALALALGLAAGLGGLARAQDRPGKSDAPETDGPGAGAVPRGPDELPPVATGPTAEAPLQGPGIAPATSATKNDPFALTELTVVGSLPRTAASSDVVRARDFELRPIRTPADLLRLVPGLHTAQHQGGGKADQILLRGFDADHGTDVAVFVDGLPVNLRSHAHGQGWADLHWVIPEFIDRVEVRKGPYFADLGDFAVAGAARLVTRDQLPDDATVYGQASYGSFDTARLVFGLSPVKTDDVKTLFGGEAYYTDGATISPQAYARFNFFGKGTAKLAKDTELEAWVSGMKSKWSGSGQIPLRAVRDGTIDYFGAIDDSEGGWTTRNNAHLQLRHLLSERDLIQVRVWGSQATLRLNSNFTFFLEDQVRGDGIQQVDGRWMGGGDARYEHVEKFGKVETKVTIGAETRTDVIELTLARQQRRRRFETTNQVSVVETSVSSYADLEVAPTKGLRLIGGVRGDAFWYTVRDQGTATIRIDGSKNDALPTGKGGIVLGPFRSESPEASTEIYFNVGSGFHSNDARAVVDTHLTTLPQAVGGEVGFRTYAFDRLDVAADMFVIDLENELVFSGDGGVPEPSGRTRRIGGELELRLRVIDEWLWVDSDVTYTEGHFTRDNAPIPLAPRLLVRSGVTLKTPIGFEANLSFRHLGRRPLDDAGTVDAPAQTVFDLVLRYVPTSFKNVEFFLRVENLFNVKWREAQFFNESQLQTETSPVGDIHFTPGVPTSVVGGVAIKW